MLKFPKSLDWYKKSAEAESLNDDVTAGTTNLTVVETTPGFKVPLTTIKEIKPHGNADKMEVAVVYGFEVIVSKDKYKVGDKVIYIPIDSILRNKLELYLFPPDAKVKPNKGRIRQIKLRGRVSQGMLIDPADIQAVFGFTPSKLEKDYATELEVAKYEPPVKQHVQGPRQKIGRKKLAHPDFHSYNGLTNIKWMPDMFENEEVVIQEKLHGTNARAGMLPFRVNTLFKKIKAFFGYAPKFERVYGSNNVDISNASTYTGYYGEDIYGKVFDKVKVFEKLKLGETVFGEIIGPSIQKGYDYGLKEHNFVLFDVKQLNPDGSQKWLSPEEVQIFAKERGFDFVPVLYTGVFDKDKAKALSMGPSVYYPGEDTREGCVIKSRYKYTDVVGNKRALKLVSEEYLADNNNTDNH